MKYFEIEILEHWYRSGEIRRQSDKIRTEMLEVAWTSCSFSKQKICNILHSFICFNKKTLFTRTLKIIDFFY